MNVYELWISFVFFAGVVATCVVALGLTIFMVDVIDKIGKDK